MAEYSYSETTPVAHASGPLELTVVASYTDPQTGAVYVHRDLVAALGPWDVENHIPPVKRTERFGDVESWAAYVQRYAGDPDEGFAPLLTWSERGLTAVLDYHTTVEPDRCQWIAEHAFERSAAWKRWEQIASGQARSQRQVLESLEDLAEDIVQPSAGELLAILRTLRATASASADSELLSDGSTRVTWSKQTGVKSAELELPATFEIAIPVLRGQTAPAADGKLVPVLYRLAVRVRVSVDDSAHLAIRLSLPGAERTLEAVLTDQVAAVRALLGEKYALYRAAV